MNVSRATSLIRKKQWMQIIADCNASGLSVRQYCMQNTVKESSYYYWLKKIRQEALEEMDEHAKDANAIVPMLQTLADGNKSNTQTYNQS